MLVVHIISVLNAVLINISIIISAILTLYFFSLYFATKRGQESRSFIVEDQLKHLKLPMLIFMGVLLGLISFLLYNNLIPTSNNPRHGIDMSYAFVYLVTLYISPLIGLISSVTLALLKYLIFIQHPVLYTPSEIINTMIFIAILTILASYLKKMNVQYWQSHFIFLACLIFLKAFSFTLYTKGVLTNQDAKESLYYLIMYTFIFLLTSGIITTTISLSQSVNVYKTAAIYDTLTGLYNKNSFEFFLDYLADPKSKQNAPLSLSILDLDNFKTINDTYGHKVGDMVLVHFSDILCSIAQEPNNYLCRIGGDEFAIMHDQPKDKSLDYYDLLQKKLKDRPFIIQKKEIYLEVSIGLCHFNVTPNFSSQYAFILTDTALYEAKRNGKNKLYQEDYTKKTA
ncbi:GGDEF domain-containing protein [Vagococcus intermedius]|uniref:GGDEF domain-containing protein n=1 Tax=Vagococcus intermedius TaxID=2991418 RepID=A0AAF0CTZ1_9ENTE|nr:GGDEF domain-containing protein [Vagococcus intermedius]WEG72878.1 GGDEF domain-containing protein [Vagococcus intermedius]WEG74965.1 GGDEF domain-containing protein [Vagococcus intermedius]